MRSVLVFALVSCAVSLAVVAPASAQSRPRPMLAEALRRTDDRIALAVSTLAAASRADAESELVAARELQAEARAGLSDDGRPRVVYDLTMRARDHADRAIAMVHGLPDPDRVMAQLEQTRDGVDRAGELLAGSPDPRAHALLREAADMQDRAEAAAQGDRYLAALQLTFGARERTLRALRMGQRQDDLPTTSARALQRTDLVMARARSALDGRPEGAASEALRRAESMQAEAQARAHASQHEAAMRLTFGARASALRALRLGPRRR